MSRICSIDAAVDHLLQTIEGPIRMGCLGLGKPNRLVNALYQRLRTLPERQLTLYTALSLGVLPLAATCNGVSRAFRRTGLR